MLDINGTLVEVESKNGYCSLCSRPIQGDVLSDSEYCQCDIQYGLTEGKVRKHVALLLKNMPDFTGKLEINFKNGRLMDINETKRMKF